MYLTYYNESISIWNLNNKTIFVIFLNIKLFLIICFNQKWQNPNMTWDPEAYDGITSLYVPVDQIWTPDIVPHNRYVITGP